MRMMEQFLKLLLYSPKITIITVLMLLYENVASDCISLNDKLTSDSNMAIAASLDNFFPQNSRWVFRRNRECRISANTCCYCSYAPPMPYKPTPLSCITVQIIARNG
ncbi:hypothetical protein T01_5085 [Trichinella spiralis]|uniref:Uncharacterized protein n=1 Tax=Trichinella spiralis TaxID=6334 RepID=A0A0V1B6U4_TRISP|nr:hypothetical protein T01_5085 [Trichinella spiralis]